MSDLSIQIPFVPATEPETRAAAEVPRSWLQRVALHTLRPAGVRLGLGWIGLIALSAIFAPFLANSLPLLVKIHGKWSSPLIANLTSTDVILLSIPVQLLLLWMFARRLTPLIKVLVFMVATLVIIGLCCWLVPPRMINGYEDYRRLEAAHQLEYVLHTPIRFSPTDHQNDRFNVNSPPPLAPSGEHLLGTENSNEDILAVMIHACRIVMAIGFISTGISVVIGIVIGSQMGYFAGAVDLIGMRVVEVFDSIPQIYLLIAFCAAFERNVYLVMAIIGLTSWGGNARFVRAEFLRLRNQDFVQSAIAAGLPLHSVLFRHILPNALAPLLVSVGFGVASAILSESVLSFLGLGLPVDAASWGRLLDEAISGGGFFWWLAVYPGLAIFLTVFAYNRIGEALRDALDPKLLTL
jgi:peptide/nickel transport system permease protein